MVLDWIFYRETVKTPYKQLVQSLANTQVCGMTVGAIAIAIAVQYTKPKQR